jgi:hypothetical protein
VVRLSGLGFPTFDRLRCKPKFVAGLGSVAARPVVARGQQIERVRRIGVLMGWSESDPEARANFEGFVEALAQLGWRVGGNLRIEQRWTDAEFARIAPFAKEVVALIPAHGRRGGVANFCIWQRVPPRYRSCRAPRWLPPKRQRRLVEALIRQSDRWADDIYGTWRRPVNGTTSAVSPPMIAATFSTAARLGPSFKWA